MSLLLDALKKAEQAKLAASAAEGEALASASPGGSGAGPQTPFMTRDRLPDIAGLELVPDDLSPAPRSAPSRPAPNPASPAVGFAAPETKKPDRRGPPKPAGDEVAARQAARQVFEAKQRDYNPRRPFHVLLGLLGLAVVGTAGYFWWQLQPKTSFVVANPSAAQPAPPDALRAPATLPVESPAHATAPAPAPAPTTATAALPAPAAQSAVPPPSAVSSIAAAPPSAASPRVETLPAPPQPMAAARAPVARRAVPAPAPGPAPVAVTPGSRHVDQNVARGYEAFQAGDLAAAREAYALAMRSDPRNRDALLGLAAVELRSGDVVSAESRYQRLLEIDPRDPNALSGIAGLRGPGEPVQTESRLRTLIAGQPDSAQLQFALGNQLAAQSRWNEAQAAFFRAFTGDPENPDFAYNLAVSLDHLRQPKLAAEYYQRAIALASQRPGAFDRSRVAARVREIER